MSFASSSQISFDDLTSSFNHRENHAETKHSSRSQRPPRAPPLAAVDPIPSTHYETQNVRTALASLERICASLSQSTPTFDASSSSELWRSQHSLSDYPSTPSPNQRRREHLEVDFNSSSILFKESLSFSIIIDDSLNSSGKNAATFLLPSSPSLSKVDRSMKVHEHTFNPAPPGPSAPHLSPSTPIKIPSITTSGGPRSPIFIDNDQPIHIRQLARPAASRNPSSSSSMAHINSIRRSILSLSNTTESAMKGLVPRKFSSFTTSRRSQRSHNYIPLRRSTSFHVEHRRTYHKKVNTHIKDQPSNSRRQLVPDEPLISAQATSSSPASNRNSRIFLSGIPASTIDTPQKHLSMTSPCRSDILLSPKTLRESTFSQTTLVDLEAADYEHANRYENWDHREQHRSASHRSERDYSDANRASSSPSPSRLESWVGKGKRAIQGLSKILSS